MTSLADRIARLSDEQRAALTARLAARSAGGIPRAPRSGDTIGLSFTQDEQIGGHDRHGSAPAARSATSGRRDVAVVTELYTRVTT